MRSSPRLRSAFTLGIVLAATLLSVASTGQRESRRLPVSGHKAYDMFPQLVVASEELGYRAYEHDDGVHVEVDDDTWIYFKVWQGKFSRTTEIAEHLKGKAKEKAQRRVDGIADDIWDLALEYRREYYGGRGSRDDEDDDGPRRRRSPRGRSGRVRVGNVSVDFD